jgi:hypothetical protein
MVECIMGLFGLAVEMITYKRGNSVRRCNCVGVVP